MLWTKDADLLIFQLLFISDYFVKAQKINSFKVQRSAHSDSSWHAQDDNRLVVPETNTQKKTDISIESDTAVSALTLLVGRQKGIWPVKNEWWGAGMVICLERGADLHTAQLMPLPLTVSCLKSIKSRLVLPFWYRLTWVVLDKRPLNGCVCNKFRKCHHPGINVLFNNNYSLLSVI